MCLKYIKVKSVAFAGIRSAYVPCGKCEDCRRKASNAWAFRLNAEFLNLKRKGWNLAFMTLTYRPKDLPKIPEECFVNPLEITDIPCFNREQVKEWIINIRQHCKYHYGFTDENRIRYFIATELGTLRHRPHMHCVLAWPSSVSYKDMHKLCTSYWKYGYLFPRRPEGDGNCLSFEVVGDPSKVLTYISKYVCKDLELDKLQSEFTFYSDRKKYEENSIEMLYYRSWRNCQSFHLQSRSLGFEAVKNLSDDEKMKLLDYGMTFSAEQKEPLQIPIYIRNKILFDPFYMYENGKRVVSKKASDFFLTHALEIFDKKSEFYQKYCHSVLNSSYLFEHGIDKEKSEELAETANYYFSKVSGFGDLSKENRLGQLYLAYNAVMSSYCYDIPLMNQWLLRYYPDANLVANRSNSDFQLHLIRLQEFFDCVGYIHSRLGSFGLADRTKQNDLIRKCVDFFKTQTYYKEIKNVV